MNMPREYEDFLLKSSAELPEFTIKIDTTETELFDFDGFASCAELEYEEIEIANGISTPAVTGEELIARMMHDAGPQKPNSTEYTTICDAYAGTRDGRFCVSYVENIGSPDETDNAFTEISFDVSEPQLVTVFRSGAAGMTLSLEPGRRHTSVYHTPFMDFELRVYTSKVINTLSENGGELYFDYALEIKGAVAHRTKMHISLKKIVTD